MTIKKKEYTIPTIEVVKFQYAKMLCGSNYGVNSTPNSQEEVDDAW